MWSWLEPPESRVSCPPRPHSGRSFHQAPELPHPGHAHSIPLLWAVGTRGQGPPQPVVAPSDHPASGISQFSRGKFGQPAGRHVHLAAHLGARAEGFPTSQKFLGEFQMEWGA